MPEVIHHARFGASAHQHIVTTMLALSVMIVRDTLVRR
jgi:hypothetical protein